MMKLKNGREVDPEKTKVVDGVTYYLIDGYVWAHENEFLIDEIEKEGEPEDITSTVKKYGKNNSKTISDK